MYGKKEVGKGKVKKTSRGLIITMVIVILVSIVSTYLITQKVILSDTASQYSGYVNLARENKNQVESLQSQLSQKQNEIQSLQNQISQKGDEIQSLQSQIQEKDILLGTSKRISEIPSAQTIGGMNFLASKGGITIGYPNLKFITSTATESMRPTTDAGHTTIYTTQFSPETLRKGDIVLYTSSDGIYIQHRIVGVQYLQNGLCYTIQGDNNPNPDSECVSPSQISGLVIGIIFGSQTQGYMECKDGYVPITKDDSTLNCVSTTLEAGVITNEQNIDNLRYYPLCSNPQYPFTVVSPSGAVQCYNSVG